MLRSSSPAPASLRDSWRVVRSDATSMGVYISSTAARVPAQGGGSASRRRPSVEPHHRSQPAPLSGAMPRGAAATPSSTSIPVQVVQTTDGAVSYRSDGSGPSLVLIMGLSGSQDTWPPDLVNALATRHRVITFDNAGIGETAMPPGTLTITAMADQTAAFITALHLHHPAVLGWSMGGMIAQALAVRHRGDVGRLVLSATFSGNGKARLPTAATASALTNAGGTDNGNATMALLFPPDQLATQGPAFIKAL